MAHLLTDYEGLQILKRALNRFNNLLKTSDDEYCDISELIKKVICGSGNLNQLLKISNKYENIVTKISQCETTGDAQEDCNCNGRSLVTSCDKTIMASDFFGVMDSLKNGQFLVLGLHNDLAQVTNLIVKNFSTEHDVLPCTEDLVRLIKHLICCPAVPVDDCTEFDRGYSIALLIVISLVFSNKLHCVKCAICEDRPLFEEVDGKCKCSDCDNCDPCAKCPRNIYEYSTSGLQVLLSLENQDNIAKWFAIIGMSLGSIARQI